MGRPAEVPFLGKHVATAEAQSAQLTTRVTHVPGRPIIRNVGLQQLMGASEAQRQQLRSAQARAAALLRFEGGLISDPRAGATNVSNLAARLRLLLTDRDFDANDYDQLLALDTNNAPSNSVATESDIRRLPTYVLTEVDLARCKVSFVLITSIARSPALSRTRRPVPTSSMTATHAHGQLSEDATSCPVCLEAYCVGDQIRTLPCLHRMHT